MLKVMHNWNGNYYCKTLLFTDIQLQYETNSPTMRTKEQQKYRVQQIQRQTGWFSHHFFLRSLVALDSNISAPARNSSACKENFIDDRYHVCTVYTQFCKLHLYYSYILAMTICMNCSTVYRHYLLSPPMSLVDLLYPEPSYSSGSLDVLPTMTIGMELLDCYKLHHSTSSAFCWSFLIFSPFSDLQNQHWIV